jgi:hypothetical protein
MRSFVAGLVMALLLVMAVGYNTPEVGSGFPKVTIVGAAAVLAGSGITTLPRGRVFYSFASAGGGTAGSAWRVYIRTNKSNGAIQDSTTLLIPVGGDDSDFIYSGLDSIEVKVAIAGDSLLVKVR